MDIQLHTTRILLSSACRQFGPEIDYACDEISLRIGRRLEAVSNDSVADAFYGPAGEETDLPHIVFDPLSYDKRAEAKCVESSGLNYWAVGNAKVEMIDHLGSVFRLLNFLDEAKVREDDRDSRGVFGIAALPVERQGVATEPLVENHANSLAKKLFGDRWESEPIWPCGKKLAVLITHDTDMAALRAPKEILFNLGKAVIRRDTSFLRRAGMGIRSFGPADTDPGFGFPSWREFADKNNAKSCFFLSTREVAKWNLSDVRSSVLDYPDQLAYLKGLARNGFEFGLHASINAKDSLDELILAKRRIEDLLETPVWGTRHHYWAIDWRNPHLTTRKQLNAGFRYDCSIAWRDSVGFRAGSCLPFRPFDPGRGRAQRMYLLPTAIMDGHLTSNEPGLDGPKSLISEIVEKTNQASGLLCLDWHTDYAAPVFAERNTCQSLQEILKSLNRDAWFATPQELVAHWHKRYTRLLGSGFYTR